MIQEMGAISLAFSHGESEPITEWHFWVVFPKDWSKNYPLCCRSSEGMGEKWGERHAPVGVTTVPEDVTCRDCIEWMHA